MEYVVLTLMRVLLILSSKSEEISDSTVPNRLYTEYTAYDSTTYTPCPQRPHLNRVDQRILSWKPII